MVIDRIDNAATEQKDVFTNFIKLPASIAIDEMI